MKFMQKYPRYHTMNKKVKFLGKGQNSMLKHRKPQKSILSGEFGDPFCRAGDWGPVFRKSLKLSRPKSKF